MTKTKAAVALLKLLGAYPDVDKVIASKTMRAGKGKMRNRRFVQRRGPLIIYKKDGGISRAFRNIPGVELADVNSLSLLQLAPGGHTGRFVIWTEAAFAALNSIFGTLTEPSAAKLHNGNPCRPPQLQMTNADLSRLINSDEVQSVVNAPKEGQVKGALKLNPLKSAAAMEALNPASAAARKRAREASEAGKTAKKATNTKEICAMKKTHYKSMVDEE